MPLKLDTRHFLQEYWQKKPLFIPQAFPGFQSPVSPDELAGLACDQEVESRIVLEKAGDYPWQALNGPFEDFDWSGLPQSHWTLLVQECNKHIPQLAELMDQFNFLPGWRMDDVMVSYAPVHGSVGPHVDQYDVFLLQAHGHRRWQINPQLTAQSPTQDGGDLRILQDFTATQEWLTAPGDLLYLPPNVAHYGVAQDDCLTISIGFRAPTAVEMFLGFGDFLHESAGDDFLQSRFSDPDLSSQAHSGLISEHAIANIQEYLVELCRDRQKIRRWFGHFITQAKNPGGDVYKNQLDLSTMHSYLQLYPLHRSEYFRFAYTHELTREGETCFLYIDGIEYRLPVALAPIAPLLCDQRRYDNTQFTQACQQTRFAELLLEFINEGYLYFEQDDDE